MLRSLIVGVVFAAAAYAQGGVWPQQMGANQLKGEQTVQVTADKKVIEQPQNISSFAEDGKGELYLLGYSNGRVYRLEE